jgi:dipeptidase E
MKKLFLASIACLTLDKIIELLPKEPSKLNLVFIPTASNLYKNKSWLYKDREKLVAMGFKVKDVDIEGKTKQHLQKELVDVDVIFVSGGNTFYLLEKTIESGFDVIVKKLIAKGVVYIGSSAGSALVSPTIEAIKSLDDPSDAPSLKSYDSLNLVPFLVMPHYLDEDYKKQYKKILKEWNNKGFELKLLTNNQALVVNGDNIKIVEA